jgi:hypothetical protein
MPGLNRSAVPVALPSRPEASDSRTASNFSMFTLTGFSEIQSMGVTSILTRTGELKSRVRQLTMSGEKYFFM